MILPVKIYNANIGVKKLAILTIVLDRVDGWGVKKFDMTRYLQNWEELTMYNFGIAEISMRGGRATQEAPLPAGNHSCLFYINDYNDLTGELQIRVDVANGNAGTADYNAHKNDITIKVYGGVAK